MGDYLLTLAFELLGSAPSLKAEKKISLIQTLAHFAGGEGMIGGQMMDIEGSSQIELMQELKTAALFRASLRFGGIIADASSSILSLLDKFALDFGKLFQVVDDLIDGDHPLGSSYAEATAQTLYDDILHTLTALPADSLLLSLTDTLYTSRFEASPLI